MYVTNVINFTALSSEINLYRYGFTQYCATFNVQVKVLVKYKTKQLNQFPSRSTGYRIY